MELGEATQRAARSVAGMLAEVAGATSAVAKSQALAGAGGLTAPVWIANR